MISDMIATHLDLEHFRSVFDWMSSEIFLNLNIYGTSILSIQLIFNIYVNLNILNIYIYSKNFQMAIITKPYNHAQAHSKSKL